jgi:transcriptional regulator with XRE-family HTH domain
VRSDKPAAKEKSIYSAEYGLALRLLKEARRKAGLTQEDIANVLGQTQSFVSKCERGERRLDLVETRAFCKAIGTPFPVFVATFERLLQGRKRT